MDHLYQVEVHQPVRYRSYLLRLWAAQPDGAGGWRASLEKPDTGQRIGFATLEELFAFLMEQAEDAMKGADWDAAGSCVHAKLDAGVTVE